VLVRAGLLLIDEASMAAAPDLPDITSEAEATGSKIILAGASGVRTRAGPGQGCLRAVSSRYSQSMTVCPVPLSWRRARSARSRSSAAVRCASLAMPR